MEPGGDVFTDCCGSEGCWQRGAEACHSRVLFSPFLGFFPQKLDGCNKMTCTGCMQYFCWLCMGSLSRANPYRHFNDPSSPCFNRSVLQGPPPLLNTYFLLFFTVSPRFLPEICSYRLKHSFSSQIFALRVKIRRDSGYGFAF